MLHLDLSFPGIARSKCHRLTNGPNGIEFHTDLLTQLARSSIESFTSLSNQVIMFVGTFLSVPLTFLH